jgi:histidinol-phosphatase
VLSNDGAPTGAPRPPEGTLERSWLDVALSLCDTADEISMRHFRRDLRIETKPDRTFVTEADREIEQAVRGRIRAAFPDHGIVGEEFGEELTDAALRWYIDPIDATNNYLRGIPVFATLIALERDGQAVVGAVSAPALGTRWYAWAGGGAWAAERGGTWAGGARERGSGPWAQGSGSTVEPRRLHVSSVPRVEDAQLLYSSVSDPATNARLPGLAATLRRAWRERGFGDFWGYALVAEGAAEAMIELGVHSWDLGPMLLLLEEAGGRLTDFEGRRTIHGRSALASNGVLHEELMRSLGARDET